jgi:uncharacterized protein (TIGR02246 family)
MNDKPPASPTLTSREEDLVAIAQLVTRAEVVQNDIEAFTALLSEDVIIVNFAGRRIFGREPFRKAMAEALGAGLGAVRTRNELVDIKLIAPDMAVVSCIKHIGDENTGTGNNLPTRGSLTLLVVRLDGHWRIALSQTTPIKV